MALKHYMMEEVPRLQCVFFIFFILGSSQSFSAPMAPPQQIPSRTRFAVFDESSRIPVPKSQPTLAAQPWAALPPSRAKENEQKAGTWNSGRVRRKSRSKKTTKHLASDIFDVIHYFSQRYQVYPRQCFHLILSPEQSHLCLGIMQGKQFDWIGMMAWR